MAGSITGATAAYLLSIQGLYDLPQLLQGFAADDVFSTPAIKSAETLMGVDGFLSAGFVYAEIVQSISIQADSDSGALFDDWWAAQQAAEDIYYANATVGLKAIRRKWTMTRGVLTGYAPIPDVKKLLQPRKFEITWNAMSPAPF
jgi:hypothetical protein